MRLGAVRLCAAFACQLNGRAPAGPIAPVTYLADTLVSNLAGCHGPGLYWLQQPLALGAAAPRADHLDLRRMRGLRPH